jgi:hypothetical protein
MISSMIRDVTFASGLLKSLPLLAAMHCIAMLAALLVDSALNLAELPVTVWHAAASVWREARHSCHGPWALAHDALWKGPCISVTGYSEK